MVEGHRRGHLRSMRSPRSNRIGRRGDGEHRDTSRSDSLAPIRTLPTAHSTDRLDPLASVRSGQISSAAASRPVTVSTIMPRRVWWELALR